MALPMPKWAFGRVVYLPADGHGYNDRLLARHEDLLVLRALPGHHHPQGTRARKNTHTRHRYQTSTVHRENTGTRRLQYTEKTQVPHDYSKQRKHR